MAATLKSTIRTHANIHQTKLNTDTPCNKNLYLKIIGRYQRTNRPIPIIGKTADNRLMPIIGVSVILVIVLNWLALLRGAWVFTVLHISHMFHISGTSHRHITVMFIKQHMLIGACWFGIHVVCWALRKTVSLSLSTVVLQTRQLTSCNLHCETRSSDCDDFLCPYMLTYFKDCLLCLLLDIV